VAARHGLIRFAQAFGPDLRSALLPPLRSGRRTLFSSMPVNQIAAQFGCPPRTVSGTVETVPLFSERRTHLAGNHREGLSGNSVQTIPFWGSELFQLFHDANSRFIEGYRNAGVYKALRTRWRREKLRTRPVARRANTPSRVWHLAQSKSIGCLISEPR
jgi:hypothetical protein